MRTNKRVEESREEKIANKVVGAISLENERQKEDKRNGYEWRGRDEWRAMTKQLFSLPLLLYLKAKALEASPVYL